MKNFKFYLSVSFIIVFLLTLQFGFVVLRDATKLDKAQKQWNPEEITLSDLGFISDRFVEDVNIKKEVISFNNKKFLVVFIGNDQSYFDRKIVSNMFIYGSDITGNTVLKDFQSLTLSPSEEKYFEETLPELPWVERIVDLDADGNPEILVNLGDYPGIGIRYTMLSYDLAKEDLKWLQIKDKNGVVDQSWFFEGYYEDAMLRFEIDQEKQSVYQFVGVLPQDLSVEEQLDLNNWKWRVDVFMLDNQRKLFIQQ